jgi:hypothetical protein
LGCIEEDHLVARVLVLRKRAASTCGKCRVGGLLKDCVVMSSRRRPTESKRLQATASRPASLASDILASIFIET